MAHGQVNNAPHSIDITFYRIRVLSINFSQWKAPIRRKETPFSLHTILRVIENEQALTYDDKLDLIQSLSSAKSLKLRHVDIKLLSTLLSR